MFYHFDYVSGGNAYIAKTETERDRIIKRHEEKGETVTLIREGFYIIDDYKKKFRNLIKGNLTYTKESYEYSAGEGVWFIVDDETKAAYDADESGGAYEGVLANDSLYYIGLNHGVILPLEMRGNRRPVVPVEWLKEHYEINKEFFKGTPEYDIL